VNNGLNAPDQVEIVYREADVLKALGQFQDANDREEYAYHVLTRAHNPNDEALLPGIYHLARWYERTNNVFAARALYQRAGNILEANDKLDTPEAIPALRGIATTHRQERFPPFYGAELENDPTSVVTTNTMRQTITVNNFPEGEAALQRIVRIRQAEVPQDPMAVAEAVLDLADWYTLFDKMSRADPLYNHAWEIMASIDAFDVVGHFADPALLYFPAPGGPSPPPVADRGERSTGYVEVAFQVTEDGYVRDLNTVASQPDGLMDFRVRKSLRLARFRPVLVNGVPIARDSFTYRHEFPYYPPVESADGNARSATTAAATPGR
jgi:TonB family protein